MKRLLVLLLISTIAYAIDEVPKEYDDVSLEINLTPIKNLVNKAKGPASKPANSLLKPIEKKVPQNVNPVINPKKNNIIKPSSNTLTKFEPHIKRMVGWAIKHVNDYLKAHPKIKNIAEPFIKEIKTHIKDPNKTIEHILKDPKNAQKIITKALKSLFDKVKSSHPFAQIKGKLRDFQNFMKKQKISVDELQKILGKSVNGIKNDIKNDIKKIPQQVRNGIYWLKKKGYWKPLLFVAEQVGQYGATALCSIYVPYNICDPVMNIAFTFVIDPYIEKKLG